MHILSLALGGCLRGEPVAYGITEDTGGHITYILGEMRALAQRRDVDRAEIVTRLFDAPELGQIHARSEEWLGPKLLIRRIDSGNRKYLAKERLAQDRKAFADALDYRSESTRQVAGYHPCPFCGCGRYRHSDRTGTGHSLYLYCPFIGDGQDADRRQFAGTGSARRRGKCRHWQCIGDHRIIPRTNANGRSVPIRPARLDRIHVLQPGISACRAEDEDIAAASDLIAPFLRDSTKPIILTIARPVRKKNLVTLVDAFAYDPDLKERCNLVILAGQRSSIDQGEAEHSQVLTQLVQAIDAHDLYGSVAYPKTHQARHVSGLYRLAAKSGGCLRQSRIGGAIWPDNLRSGGLRTAGGRHQCRRPGGQRAAAGARPSGRSNGSRPDCRCNRPYHRR